MIPVVYFSTKSGNTRRFVDSLATDALRIPYESDADPLTVDSPYVLVFPTYGGGHLKGAVPKPVIHFLNDPHNRALIRGVVGVGNTNFGQAFCYGAHVVSGKCQVPLIHRVELFGTPEDVATVNQELQRFGYSH